jgi:hypothetical protein
LRGEYEALFESGGRARGAVKRHAGRSPDELAQLAHESGFIDEADPALLKEALERDLAGDKVHSIAGALFERKLDLEIEREFQRWAEAEEASYFDELNAKAKAILDTEDTELPTGELIDNSGRLSPITRSAKELLAEMDDDAKPAT